MNIINEKYNDLSSFNIIFKNAKPYPHIILDNFLEENFFLNLNTESFSIQKYRNDHLDTFLERKKSNSRNVDLSYEIKKLVNELNSEKFLTNLGNFYYKSKKLEVIHQSINKTKINFKKKKK